MQQSSWVFFNEHNNIHNEQSQLITLQHTIQKARAINNKKITMIKTARVAIKQKSSFQFSIGIQFSSVILQSWAS